MIQVGDEAYYTKTILGSDISNFANITGDFNPNSVNAWYLTLKNQKATAQNILLQGLISASLGAKMPGFGTIFLSQETEFLKPVYENDTIIVKSEVIDIKNKARFSIAKIKMSCFNQHSELVAMGISTVIPPKTEEMETN